MLDRPLIQARGHHRTLQRCMWRPRPRIPGQQWRFDSAPALPVIGSNGRPLLAFAPSGLLSEMRRFRLLTNSLPTAAARHATALLLFALSKSDTQPIHPPRRLSSEAIRSPICSQSPLDRQDKGWREHPVTGFITNASIVSNQKPLLRKSCFVDAFGQSRTQSWSEGWCLGYW